jgi:murein DD-endopeptidase MepM/ murein hydrolase activator NlpD
MKLDEMKVQYERERDGFTHESDFTVQKEKKDMPKVDASGITVKIGLCAAVLALAFIVRAFGFGKPAERVAETSAHSDGNQAASTSTVGSLHYVEAGTRKWAAPVKAVDIELLLDGRLLRFTAGSGDVHSCCAGKVLSTGTDEQYGNFVRVQTDDDFETVYYGLDEILVTEGVSVRAGDLLGNVPVGRSMYLRVYQNGAPQDPSQYVDLGLQN